MANYTAWGVKRYRYRVHHEVVNFHFMADEKYMREFQQQNEYEREQRAERATLMNEDAAPIMVLSNHKQLYVNYL